MFTKVRLLGLLAVVALLGVGVARHAMTAEPAGKDNSKLDAVNMRYAEANLALAEAELNKAMGANRRFANTYPSAAIEYLHRSVDIAQARLQSLKNPDPKNRYASFIALSEGALKIAEADYNKAKMANERAGASVSPEELERLRCTVDVARLRYERAQLADDQPEAVVTHWYLQEIADEVLRLRGRVEMLSRRD
jgi:hypothetical protein